MPLSMLLILIVINIIVVIYCQSDILEIPKRKIWNWLYKNRPYKEDFLRHLQCDWCVGTWLGILFVLIVNPSLTWIAVAMLIAYFNPVTSTALIALKDWLIKLLG